MDPSGGGSLKLLKPVADGDELEVDFDGDKATAATNDGKLCAILELTTDAATGLEPIVERPLPVRRWEASEESFHEHGFGTYRQTVSEEQARQHLHEVAETLAIYEEEAILHPAHLLRFASLALTANYRLGPWLHASSTIHYTGLVLRGTEVRASARLLSCFERKGNRFVEIEVQVLPGATIRHSAIYEPAFLRSIA